MRSETSYTLIRKNVKNINLSVKPDGSIVVSANPCVPEDYIDEFVHSKMEFIHRARERLKQRNGQPVPQFVTGEKFPYLGDLLTLQMAAADRRLVPEWIQLLQEGCITGFCRNDRGEAVFCRGKCLQMYSTQLNDAVHNRQLYESWQKVQTGVLCERLSRKYYPVFQEMGVAYPQIKIRKMSSRWGSCIPAKKKLTFNSLLLEKPLESIEYVVVHEFSHFIHPNHSKAFYGLVEQILPDYKARKERLDICS